MGLRFAAVLNRVNPAVQIALVVEVGAFPQCDRLDWAERLEMFDFQPAIRRRLREAIHAFFYNADVEAGSWHELLLNIFE